jgi:hypothetical protein
MVIHFGNHPLGRLRHKLTGYIKIDLREKGCEAGREVELVQSSALCSTRQGVLTC